MNDKKINPIIPAIVAVVAIILLVFLGLQLLGTSEDSMTDDSSESAMQENSNETVSVGGAAMFSDRTIVDNVVNAPNLSTLVSAVQAADLVETLQGDGPFTVFGPDNDAFDKLPAGTLQELTKPENKEQLSNILTYHVVSGTYLTSDLQDGQRLMSLQGDELLVRKEGSMVYINDALITTADVLQSNGVAHVVDTVLLPPSDTTEVGGAAMFRDRTIVDNVVNAPNLTTLVSAVQAADLVDSLADPNTDVTVFGPDNNAFEKLPSGTLEQLTQPENKDQLTGILTYHVVPGSYSTAQLYDGQILTTLNGETLMIQKSGSSIRIVTSDGSIVANVITPNVFQSNGVAHVIDTVLIPEE